MLPFAFKSTIERGIRNAQIEGDVRDYIFLLNFGY